jgi:hypothetical protein
LQRLVAGFVHRPLPGGVLLHPGVGQALRHPLQREFVGDQLAGDGLGRIQRLGDALARAPG